jgi:hypothetical protein
MKIIKPGPGYLNAIREDIIINRPGRRCIKNALISIIDNWEGILSNDITSKNNPNINPRIIAKYRNIFLMFLKLV